MALRPLASLAGFAAGVIRLPIGRYVVEGPSMEPAYRAGDRVLVNRLAYLRRPPVAGDVVVLRDPERNGHILLKRIARAPEGVCPGPAQIYVLGDNAGASRDSRAFGLVDRRKIVGRAWLVY
jgi:nickel-type superoxide dismutase maturation protease